jgi:hypothetical protein
VQCDHSFALRRRKNAQPFAVFRHRSTGDVNVFAGQLLADVLVAPGLARILFRDDVEDLAAHALGGDVVSVARVEAAREEPLELEDALRSVDVFTRSGAADGGFVHADVACHVLEHHGAKRAHPL